MSKPVLLWMFPLCALPYLSVGHVNLDELREYEVIRPIRLHAVHKRSIQSSRPDEMKYGMRVEEKDIVMELEKTEGLLAKEYSEVHYTEDGARVVLTPKDLDHCYYQGRIVNDSESVVSMSTCSGLRGYIKTAGQRYLIEPLAGSDTEDHALLNYENLNDQPSVCGVTNSSWDPNYPPSTSRFRSRGSSVSLLQQQKYLELYVVADNRMYEKMKKNFDEVRKRIFEIVNFVNTVYKPLNTFVALIGLEVWTDQDKIPVVAPAGTTLTSFTDWRNTQLVKSKAHDNAQLITGIDFEGATVGLAFVGTLCSAHSTGVIQDHNSNAIAVGATLAHEMGHNLGMSHDSSSCICAGNTCIMAAALSYNIPRSFSSCSDGSYEQFLTSRNPQCLFDKPKSDMVISTPVCGNGFVEREEECDCGLPEECKDACCNATSCKLNEGAQCSQGECCENCKLMGPSRECRHQVDECDLAEYCTGKSTDCPEDVFSVNGIPCKDGKGYCYNGQCPQHTNQCIKMWGDTATVAQQSCFDQNTRGIYYAFCDRPLSGQYIGCQKQDVMCGKLFCTGGKDVPNYGRSVTFLNCKATFYGDADSDFGQVDPGTKCGEGLVCSNHECVNLERAYRATNCSAKCKGHAVCNHRLECQCEPGWLPPNCDQVDQGGQQLSPGAIIAIVVVTCLLILISLVAVFLVKRKRRTPSSRRLPCPEQSGVTNPTFGQQQNIPDYKVQTQRPKGPPPPPPASGQSHNLLAARQALRPPPPRV